MTKEDGPYRAPAVERADRILELVASVPKPPSLSEIARETGFGKSTVHGLLATMVGVGWLIQREGGYALGPRLASLSPGGALRDLGLIARPFLEELAEKLGESVCVGRFVGERLLIMDCVEGRGGIRIAPRSGLSLPLLAAATGKAYLAAVPPEEAKTLLADGELPGFTERSIVDPAKFLEEVDLCRERGWAADEEEYLRGVRAVAAAIVLGGRPVAALWAVGFTRTFNDETRHTAALGLKRAAAIVSRLLTPQ